MKKLALLRAAARPCDAAASPRTAAPRRCIAEHERKSARDSDADSYVTAKVPVCVDINH